MKHLKKLNEYFDTAIDNIVDIFQNKSRKQRSLGFYLLKSSPELIKPVSEKLLSKFEIKRKYKTLDELVNDENLKVQKDMWEENAKLFSVEFFKFELNNIFIAASFSTTFLENVSLISPTLLITNDPKRILYVSKPIKTNEDILDTIYDLMEKSWNPIIKSKSLLNQIILDVEEAIEDLDEDDEDDEDDEAYYNEEEE